MRSFIRANSQKLLTEDKSHLKKAMDVAILMKLAENEACKKKAGVEDVNEPESIYKVTIRSKLCYRYGKIHHFPDNCFYNNN